MLKTLRKGAAWRWALVAMLLAGMLLSLMPMTAQAASADPAVATTSREVSHYGYTCSSYYTVHKGDTLLGIARWYGVTLHNIAAANGITNPSYIYPGQVLCIPSGYTSGGHSGGHSGGCYYTVQAGDNLSRIAARFRVTWPYLASVNHLSNARVIVPGQVLYICW